MSVFKEVQKQIEAFHNAMDEEQYIEEEKILKHLEETTAPIHPLLLEFQTRYDIETMMWEK